MTASYNQISIDKYRQHAPGYDASAQLTMPLRKRTIALLELSPGDVVLDVGAGTGLSYPLLLDAVGASGRLLAFEQSPQMFAQAQARCAREPGANSQRVWHECAAAENVMLPEAADAVLFNYVHDISRTPAAVANIMRQMKPGARVVASGLKWADPGRELSVNVLGVLALLVLSACHAAKSSARLICQISASLVSAAALTPVMLTGDKSCNAINAPKSLRALARRSAPVGRIKSLPLRSSLMIGLA